MTSYRQETDESNGSNFTIIEPTCRLRWKKMEYIGYDGLKYEAESSLQQLWEDKFTGTTEWRDIPTE